MSRKLYSQVVGSDSDAELGQEQATTGYASSWLVKFQREARKLLLRKQSIMISATRMTILAHAHTSKTVFLPSFLPD